MNSIDEEIAQLRIEAARAGDEKQVALCDDAMNGSADARARCIVVLDDARELAAEEERQQAIIDGGGEVIPDDPRDDINERYQL
jgi:hypothetical protein